MRRPTCLGYPIGRLYHFFLNRQRLEYAAQRLCVEPDTSITDIALRCAFQSSQYFSTQFKKHQRCPPKVYRETGSEKV